MLSTKKVKLITTLVPFLLLLNEGTTSTVPRPRGVSLSAAPLYDPTKNFTCLDGSSSVVFEQVNDDYCDCADGSDEPGTSACPDGVFHCTNAGHRPTNLAASRVNDGVCDCCDGTDEYVSDVCENNCKELGKSAREEAVRKAELLKAGKQIRVELSERGLKLKQEKKERLVELEKHKVEAEKVLKEKDELKKEIEELENAALEEYRKIEDEQKRAREEAQLQLDNIEAQKAFVRFDYNKDGVLDVVEIQAHLIFDKDQDGLVSLEEAKHFLSDNEFLKLDDFITQSWILIKPLINEAEIVDENRKEEVGSEDYETKEDDVDEPNEGEEEEEEDEEQGEQETEPEQVETVQGVVYDEETQNLVNKANDARNHYMEADKAVRGIQSEIKEIEEYLQKDFGPNESFAPLEGNCFEYTDYEYIYKLCPFDKVTQQAKSGTVDTRLGTWSKWTDSYETMLYEKGQSCWNGPQRSATVKVHCGSENRVTSVSEPNRCEYHMAFETPAACFEAEVNEDVHDEL